MGKCIVAHTNLDEIYPGYINFTREDDGTVSVYLRGDPSQYPNGGFVCGFAGADTGKHGRCTPGDDRCNNYCNMAPQRGPMQPSPAPCVQVKCGETVKLTLPAAAFESLRSGLSAVALFGEAGPEAIMPLRRDASGNPGVLPPACKECVAQGDGSWFCKGSPCAGMPAGG